MKEIALFDNVYEFSIGCDLIDLRDILNIHEYFIKKT